MFNPKIAELTPEQAALIPVYLEKWQKFVLSTERIDREKASEAVKAAYTFNGYREPEIFILDSPYNGLLEISKLQHSGENLGAKLNQKVQHHNKWVFQIPEQLNSNLHQRLNKELYHPVSDLGRLFTPLDRQLQKNLLFPSSDYPTGFYNQIPYHSLANGYCFYDFCISVLKCEHDRGEWETSKNLIEVCGWILPFEKVCVICDRPTKILLDDNNRLHAIEEPALVFADGFTVYAYHGSLMPEKYSSVPSSQWQPEWYLEESDFRLREALIKYLPAHQLQANWLLEEEHPELRQLLIQKIGFNRIYQELGIQDNLNILSQVSQSDSGSSFGLAYTLLQNQEEPRIKQIINNFIYAGNSQPEPFIELRKAVMIDSLERIFNWLKQNCPSYAAGFLPGLYFEEIEEKFSNLPFKLPREVYDLYQWRNGTNSEAMIFVYHYFWDLDTALQLSADWNDVVLMEERKEAGEPLYLFPIFEFEGEFFAVQGNITEVETVPVFHIGVDGEGISLAFNSLATMMLTIAESYETGVYKLMPEGRIEWNDAEKSRLIRMKYNPGTAKRLYF